MKPQSTITIQNSIPAGIAREDIQVTISTPIVQSSTATLGSINKQIVALQNRIEILQSLADQISAATETVTIPTLQVSQQTQVSNQSI